MEEMESDAVARLRDIATSVKNDITKAQDRYETAGLALTAYAAVHRTAQDAAEALRLRAVTTQTEIDTAQTELTEAKARLRNAEENLNTMGTPIPDHVTQRFNTAKTTLVEKQVILTRIQNELPAIIATWNTAATTAEAAITTVITTDAAGDGFWDNHGSKIASWVSEWAGIISEYVGYLALVLAWVPVLGPVLIAVTLIAGIAALIADMALYANGEGSLLKVLLGTLSALAIGAGLKSTLNAKRLAETAMKQGKNRMATIVARSNSPAMRTAKFEQKFPTTIRSGSPNTWFNQGLRSFEGLNGKAWVANFFGHTEAAWAAQSLRNAESLTTKFVANSAGGYTITLEKIWDQTIVKTIGANGVGLISVNTFRVVDHFLPPPTPLFADEALNLP